MEQLHQELGGDGFVSIKTMSNNQVHHFHLKRLSTNQSTLFICNEKQMDPPFTTPIRIGPYVFKESLFHQVDRDIEEMMKKGISPIFLDEIGLLEIEGSGFFPTLKKLLLYEKDVYVTIRKDILQRAIIVFQIEDYILHETT